MESRGGANYHSRGFSSALCRVAFRLSTRYPMELRESSAGEPQHTTMEISFDLDSYSAIGRLIRK